MVSTAASTPPASRYARFARRLPLGLDLPFRVLGTVEYLLLLARLVYRAAVSPLWEGRRGRKLSRMITLQQIFFTAVQSLPLTVLVAVAIGALLMHQASVLLPLYGFPEYAEWLTVLVLFREITPMTVALIVIARSANAIVIEVGNMKVNGELRALEVLGINLDRYLLLPRILGMVVAMVLLTICFCASALWGGFWVAKISGLLESTFLLRSLERNLTLPILENILLRALAFGVAVAAVACLHGLRVRRSPTEVPQQASRGVVRSLAICFVLNFVISVYGGGSGS